VIFAWEDAIVSNIAVIDDDLAMDLLSDSLCLRGHEAYRIGSVTDALHDIERIMKADVVVLDIIMPWPKGRSCSGLRGPHTAGLEILQEIRKRKKDLPVIAYSATQDRTVIDVISDDANTVFLSKWEAHSIKELIHRIYRTLVLKDEIGVLQPFIVHGQNETLKLALKNYLQNTLRLPEPIILHEQPNIGRTIIEKFEDYADMASIIFVLLTPDDVAASVNDTNDIKRRARQNVIFELGYFLGMLGRKSGRVLLLYQPPLELPSDISGVVYIDISSGIEAAGEKIRLEVENVRD
jgi:predicted nucleotide-binding protein